MIDLTQCVTVGSIKRDIGTYFAGVSSFTDIFEISEIQLDRACCIPILIAL